MWSGVVSRVCGGCGVGFALGGSRVRCGVSGHFVFVLRRSVLSDREKRVPLRLRRGVLMHLLALGAF